MSDHESRRECDNESDQNNRKRLLTAIARLLVTLKTLAYEEHRKLKYERVGHIQAFPTS